MYVRVTLTLDLNVRSPGEAAKVLEPMLAAMPAETEFFSQTMKGQRDFFAERNGKRVRTEKKVARVRDTAY